MKAPSFTIWIFFFKLACFTCVVSQMLISHIRCKRLMWSLTLAVLLKNWYDSTETFVFQGTTCQRGYYSGDKYESTQLYMLYVLSWHFSEIRCTKDLNFVLATSPIAFLLIKTFLWEITLAAPYLNHNNIKDPLARMYVYNQRLNHRSETGFCLVSLFGYQWVHLTCECSYFLI